ncbi:MAG TPA: malic enzyme-like NAD(P)-binding protein [Gemmataceae bacterium]|nr:malic enzyme-like NAD(P)-binding protein [Gemmataceae bacterium]
MRDHEPYCDYRMTVRVELPNRPGQFARLATAIAEENANLGAIDIVEARRDKKIRDITFDAQSEAHARRVLERLRALPEVRVLSASDRIFLMHLGGKIHTRSKIPLRTRNALSMVYTPGVARISRAIAEDNSKAYAFTSKANSVAVVTDGSAVLGLGNLGPEAALPVMEGKVMLLKEFADIDGWPLCLATQDTDAIVRLVEAIAPTFGGINLEDISAPRCFDIEERLRRSLDIPVMHDDQHGTAVVLLAALQNALKVVGKDLHRVKVVVNGLGAAGTACCRILLAAGVRHLIGCDRQGAVLHAAGGDLSKAQSNLRACINFDEPILTLREAMTGADVFIGLSAANVLRPVDLQVMARDPIVFAMANPDPEIEPSIAAPLCRILATGRSDYPNQVNNLLAFPGIFRGALDVRAREINEPMKLAAARAIASVIPEDHLSEDYIVPSVFDKRVVQAVARAVARAAHERYLISGLRAGLEWAGASCRRPAGSG